MSRDRAVVQEILEDALAAVQAAKIPQDLRELALGKAIDLLTGTSPSAAASDAAAVGTTPPDGGLTTPSVTGYERVDAIAKKFGLDDATKLLRVYDIEDTDVGFVAKRKSFGNGKAAATRSIGLLYAAARQAGGYDAGNTTVNAIRAAVEHMGVYDSPNFMSEIRNIEGVTVKGTGQSREVKVLVPGFEAAGALVTSIAAGGES